MLGVHQESCEFIAILVQTEEYTKAHIVDAALHGAVMSLGVVGIVMLGAGGMELLIALLVVGLLEEDVGADAGLLELAVVLHGGGGDVHIYPADIAVFVVDGIDGLDGLQHIFDGVVNGILAQLQGKALVTHVLQGDDLGADLLLGQLFSGDTLVLQVVGAVQTAVDAVVGQVQGRKHDDPVAVEVLLDLLGQGVDLLVAILQLTGQQHGGLPVGQTLAQLCLFDDGIDQLCVRLVGIGIGQGLLDFLMVDKLLGLHGFGIIHIGHPFSFHG